MSWTISKSLMEAYESSRSSRGREAESSAVTCADSAVSAPLK